MLHSDIGLLFYLPKLFMAHLSTSVLPSRVYPMECQHLNTYGLLFLSAHYFNAKARTYQRAINKVTV